MPTDGPVWKTPQFDAPHGAGQLLVVMPRKPRSARATRAVPSDTIAPERLRVIRYRLATGFYDSDDARGRIVAAVGPDL